MKTFAINLHFIAGTIEGIMAAPRQSHFLYGLQNG